MYKIVSEKQSNHLLNIYRLKSKVQFLYQTLINIVIDFQSIYLKTYDSITVITNVTVMGIFFFIYETVS